MDTLTCKTAIAALRALALITALLAPHVYAAGAAGHAHDHEGLTWPPQPRGISNIVIHSGLERELKERPLERSRMDRLERKARDNARAKGALGNRFTRVTVIDKEDKRRRRSSSEMVFFSRDRNATVKVEFDKNEQVQAVSSVPAWEYQPEITDEETAEAAALAATHFLSQGFAQIAGLKAFGILAYRPEGVGFFDSRVLYISFHEHDDAPPEFVAWVDLTKQLVLKARKDH